VAVRQAALVSDEKRIRGVFAMMRYTNWRPFYLLRVCDVQRKSGEVRAQRSQLKQIEDLSAGLEERLILDNRYVLLSWSMVSFVLNYKIKMWSRMNVVLFAILHFGGDIILRDKKAFVQALWW